MTDEEVLEKWRTKRGDKHLTLTTALELEKLSRKFAHLEPRRD